MGLGRRNRRKEMQGYKIEKGGELLHIHPLGDRYDKAVLEIVNWDSAESIFTAEQLSIVIDYLIKYNREMYAAKSKWALSKAEIIFKWLKDVAM